MKKNYYKSFLSQVQLNLVFSKVFQGKNNFKKLIIKKSQMIL